MRPSLSWFRRRWAARVCEGGRRRPCGRRHGATQETMRGDVGCAQRDSAMCVEDLFRVHLSANPGQPATAPDSPPLQPPHFRQHRKSSFAVQGGNPPFCSAPLRTKGGGNKKNRAMREIISRTARKHPPKHENTLPKRKPHPQNAGKHQNTRFFSRFRAKVFSPHVETGNKFTHSSTQRSTNTGDCRPAAVRHSPGNGKIAVSDHAQEIIFLIRKRRGPLEPFATETHSREEPGRPPRSKDNQSSMLQQNNSRKCVTNSSQRPVSFRSAPLRCLKASDPLALMRNPPLQRTEARFAPSPSFSIEAARS